MNERKTIDLKQGWDVMQLVITKWKNILAGCCGNMTMNERKTIDLEQGRDAMQSGITQLKNILEGLPEPQFSLEAYMMLYTTIYNMCTQKPPHDYSQQLYDKYRESCEDYITSMVLSSLREKHNELMLRVIDEFS